MTRCVVHYTAESHRLTTAITLQEEHTSAMWLIWNMHPTISSGYIHLCINSIPSAVQVYL